MKITNEMISRISHRVRPYVHNDTDEEFQNSWKHELVKNGITTGTILGQLERL